jgi:beta-glucosidase
MKTQSKPHFYSIQKCLFLSKRRSPVPNGRGRKFGVCTPVVLSIFLGLLCVLSALCGEALVGSQAVPDNPAIVDSQDFLTRNMRAAGPPATRYAPEVEKLLAQMTLKEKIGQMTQLALPMITDGKDNTLKINPEKLHKAIGEYGVGSILGPYDQAMPPAGWTEIIGAIQSEAHKTRLKIPVLYGIDSIHGPTYVAGGTLFPQPLGMAATWNPELMLRASQISAAETRAAGIPWNFSPVLDIGRQPLWPRLYETFGEDPYLATVMGVAAVRGYEGETIENPRQVAACLKHYVGYSFPTTGHDRTPALIPDRTLREYFLPTFAAAVRAGAHSVMVNSGEVNGIPGHANRYLLTDVLRGELGFKGVVVSDWQDIKRLVTVHHVAATERDATRIAVMAGVDMNMVPEDFSFSDLLYQLVEERAVPLSRIDEAVRRILTLKYGLGLFDDPLLGTNSATKVGSDESRQVSLEAARESIVLLKNANRILPLSKTVHVLVTGPAANSLVPLNNGWTYTWQGDREDLYPADRPTIVSAIKSKVGEQNVSYIPGAEYDKELDIGGAVEAAKTADFAVVCLGEKSYAESRGNIDDLALPDAQLRLAGDVAAAGKPVVLLLVEGRPRTIRNLADSASAIIVAFNPGNEGGQAIADMLFGDVNPSARLPVTYPRFPDALLTYDHKWSEEQDAESGAKISKSLFEFGYGLSYTTFEYSALQVTPPEVSGQTPAHVSVTVKNSGDREGVEVVQLYLSQVAASITPPVRRLKRFAKVSLRPSESKQLSFDLTRDDFSFIGQNNKPVVEPGKFEVLVGNLKASFDLK